MVWSGTGSGPFFGSTGTLNSNFTITSDPGVYVTGWNLVVYINGTQRGAYNCTASEELRVSRRPAARAVGTSCSGPITLTAQTFALPATLSNWEVDLRVTADYGDGGTLTVSVPGSASIDLLTQAPPNPAPAPASLTLGVTGILFVGLVWFGTLRRNSTRAGFPGQTS
jgi:hypothetical protein